MCKLKTGEAGRPAAAGLASLTIQNIYCIVINLYGPRTTSGLTTADVMLRTFGFKSLL